MKVLYKHLLGLSGYRQVGYSVMSSSSSLTKKRTVTCYLQDAHACLSLHHIYRLSTQNTILSLHQFTSDL